MYPRPASYAKVLLSRIFSATCLSSLICLHPIQAEDSGVSRTAELREKVKQIDGELQQSEKDLSLRKAALDVAATHVAELKKQLDEAVARSEKEKAELNLLQEKVNTQTAQRTALSEEIAKNENADAAQVIADKAAKRLSAIVGARTQLEAQLSTLRKQSVEWQSRAVEADQQIKALEAQKPEIQKAITDTKTAVDAAVAQVKVHADALTAATQVSENHKALAAAESARLEAARAGSTKLEKSVAALQASLELLRVSSADSGVKSDDAVNSLTESIEALKPLITNTTGLIQQISDRHAAAVVLVEAARVDIEKKTADHKVAVDAEKKAQDAHQQSVARLAAIDPQQSTHREVMVDAQSRQQALASQILGLEPSIQKLVAEIQLIRSETVTLQKAAESALEPLGRFVSFSRHVAPILAERCIACHNTRSPGGRLNLDSFAAMNKGGESGQAVKAHHSSESLLLTMTEDGSMPKDADPLSKEEIEIIRSWINVGAPLDAGVIATAELFDVIPEMSQPLPPQTYRVAIPVTATAFSPDGSLLASSGYHEVLLWNSNDGTLVRRISNVAERVYDVEFTANGQQLVVAAGTPGQLGELKVFSTADGTLQDTLVRAKDAIFSVSLSPDGTRAACGGADRSIVVVSLADGQQITKIEDHADWVMDVNWSPVGSRLVSSSRDKTSKVFDSETGDPVITFSGHGEPVYSAAFLSDGKTVVSGGGDKKLHVWNTADAKELRAMAGFGGEVFRVLVAAGDRVYSASADRNIREHNAADGQLIRTLSGHSDWVYTVTLNTARNVLATGSYDGEIRVWNSQDGSTQTSFIGIPKEQAAAANVTAVTK
ncbi:MAG: PQQ-binding-like beta-propeller repeat protein [Planctomyces sp.]